MRLPPKVFIPITIEQGSIYHYRISKVNKDGTQYDGSRFFIVLSTNPKIDEVLILTTITKQIDNQKKFIKRIREDKSTLVLISTSDLPFLSQDSVVNCNNFHEITLEALISKIEDGGKVLSHKLPKTIMNELISGVLKSNQVPPDVKEKLI